MPPLRRAKDPKPKKRTKKSAATLTPKMEKLYKAWLPRGLKMKMKVCPSNAVEAEAMARKLLGKGKGGGVGRPHNQFILFQISFKAAWKRLYGNEDPAVPQRVVTKILSHRYNALEESDHTWKSAQDLVEAAHRKLYVEYKYTPGKRNDSIPDNSSNDGQTKDIASESLKNSRSGEPSEFISAALNITPYKLTPPSPLSPLLPTTELPDYQPEACESGPCSPDIDVSSQSQGLMLQEVYGRPGLFFEDELADVRVSELPHTNASAAHVEHSMEQAAVMSGGDLFFGAPTDQNYIDGTSGFLGLSNQYYNEIDFSFSGDTNANTAFLTIGLDSEESWYYEGVFHHP